MPASSRSTHTQSLPFLSDTQLETWFEDIVNHSRYSSTTTPDKINRLLHLFGIQSARDVIAYLQSPAGLITQTLLRKKITEMITLQNNTRQQHTRILAHQRALAFLILGLLHKKEARQLKQLFELIQKQIDHELNDDTSSKKPEHKTDLTQPMLEEYLNYYHAAVESIQHELNHRESLSKHLESEWLDFEKMILMFNDEYALFNQFMDEMHSTYTEQAWDAVFAHEQITRLTAHGQRELGAIQSILESGLPYDESALLLRLQENEARKLQLAVLHDFQDAVPSNKKIIQKDGKCYLLPVNLPITALSISAKEEAHQAYLHLKPRLNATQLKLETAHALEQEQHTKQRASLTDRSELLQQELRQLTLQHAQLQASIATVSTLLDQARKTPTPTLTPSPKPTPATTSKPKPTASSSYASCIFRLELCKLRNNPTQSNSLSPQSLANLNNTTPIPALTQQQQTATAQLKITPGAPCSPLITRAILRYNNGLIAQQLHTFNPNQPIYQSPTPFNMQPKLKPEGMS